MMDLESPSVRVTRPRPEEGRGQKRKRESDDRECERSPSPPAMIVTVTRHVYAWRHELATPYPLVCASFIGLCPVPSLRSCCAGLECSASTLGDIFMRYRHEDIQFFHQSRWPPGPHPPVDFKNLLKIPDGVLKRVQTWARARM